MSKKASVVPASVSFTPSSQSWHPADQTDPRSVSLRRAWFSDHLWDMQKEGIITDWSWSKFETTFFSPMTKPPLSEDQVSMMLAAYLEYVEKLEEAI